MLNYTVQEQDKKRRPHFLLSLKSARLPFPVINKAMMLASFPLSLLDFLLSVGGR